MIWLAQGILGIPYFLHALRGNGDSTALAEIRRLPKHEIETFKESLHELVFQLATVLRNITSCTQIRLAKT